LGESHGFEPYTKVGIIVPISGTLDIETNRDYKTFVGANQVADTQAFLKMLLSPIQLLALCQYRDSYKLERILL
jgi:hypothetical protein